MEIYNTGVSQYLPYEKGDGTKVMFWHDLWCEDCSLKETYPKFLGNNCGKDSSCDL